MINSEAPTGHGSSAPLPVPGDQPVPPAELKQREVEELADLLAEVVLLAGDHAWFPGHLHELAERAREYPSVQNALHHLCDEQEQPGGGRPVVDFWRDGEGTEVVLGCRVEQVAVHREHGGLRRRLHRPGQVISYGLTRVAVRFDGEDQPVSIRPHLLQVV